MQFKIISNLFLLLPKHKSTLLICLLQLFMCVLWILLQLAVVFMYWDLPPLEKRRSNDGPKLNRENTQGLLEEEDEGEEEVKPLMSSHELVGSYGSVVTSHRCKKHTTSFSSTSLNHIHSPPASPENSHSQKALPPFRNTSIFRGNWLL